MGGGMEEDVFRHMVCQLADTKVSRAVCQFDLVEFWLVNVTMFSFIERNLLLTDSDSTMNRKCSNTSRKPVGSSDKGKVKCHNALLPQRQGYSLLLTTTSPPLGKNS